MRTVRFIHFLLAVLAVIFFVRWRTIRANHSADDDAEMARLNQPIAEVKLKWVPLRQAIQTLAQSSGCAIEPRWGSLKQAGIDPEEPVELMLHDVTLEQALKTLIALLHPSAPIDYDASGMSIVLAAEADLPHLVRIYDLRDLVPPEDFQIADEPNGSLQLPRSYRSWGDEEVASMGNALATLDGSDDAFFDKLGSGKLAGASPVDEWSGRLTVIATRQRHRQIRELLEKIRQKGLWKR
jgi:hypothetical protein